MSEIQGLEKYSTEIKSYYESITKTLEKERDRLKTLIKNKDFKVYEYLRGKK